MKALIVTLWVITGFLITSFVVLGYTLIFVNYSKFDADTVINFMSANLLLGIVTGFAAGTLQSFKSKS